MFLSVIIFVQQTDVFVLLAAIGFLNGMVRLVDSLSLEDCTSQPFNNTNREAITHMAFSQNCEYFATAVCLYFPGDVFQLHCMHYKVLFFSSFSKVFFR